MKGVGSFWLLASLFLMGGNIPDPKSVATLSFGHQEKWLNGRPVAATKK
jgi:hypothetical protein